MQIYRFWKPYNVLTKFTDADGRPTLADYIDVANVYAAGRLDMDSEGLLLLTDSGALQHRLSDPRFEHPKTYWAQVERIPDETALESLRRGVELSEGGKLWRTKPAQARLIDPPDIPERPVPIRYRAHIPTTWLELTISEGKNRQVRRMTAAVGYPTLRLVRWAIGSITLAGLQPGQYQALTKTEIEQIRRW
ncbi:MAG: pseudouridine synthase [Chloroflexi bacterium]|uniref:pseudouridine synthase n=1 Tax=Candidatus Flexifilum breve TaxID=3140694 RepID=UPI0031348FC9|nr:pseudouridine synthase [Chloroflexota bacterium]